MMTRSGTWSSRPWPSSRRCCPYEQPLRHAPGRTARTVAAAQPPPGRIRLRDGGRRRWQDAVGPRQQRLPRSRRRPGADRGRPGRRRPLRCRRRRLALEERLAAFVGLPRALFFSSGYLANLGVVTSLVGPGDAVFSDELNHASLIDGIRLSGAEKQIYPHLDLAALAPLPALLELCERHDAWLLADDAHGFGVQGIDGRGSLAHFGIASPRIVYIGTLGKAAGVSGAFAAGAAEVIEWMVQRARTYIFTTGTPPLLAHALLTSIDLIEQGEARRSQLRRLIAQLRGGLRLKRWRLLDSSTAIQPVVIGENSEALRVGAALLEAGLWVPVIRPPTVAPGTSRLRISLSAAHSAEQVERLVASLNALE